MQTTLGFYLVFALIIVLPLLLFNLRKFVTMDEDGVRHVHKIRICVVSVLSVVVILFSIGLYNFTLHYQPMLVAERYVSEFGKLRLGQTSLEEFEAATAEYTDYAENEAEVAEFLQNASTGNSTYRFQIGDEITNRYYVDTNDEVFQAVENPEEGYTVYIGILAEVDGNTENYLLLIRRPEDNHCRVENIYTIDDEGMEYLKGQKLMRGDLVSKWFEVK